MKRLYDYLKGTEWHHFRSLKAMKEFAKNENNDGTYYIACPSITFRYSRIQVLNLS